MAAEAFQEKGQRKRGTERELLEASKTGMQGKKWLKKKKKKRKKGWRVDLLPVPRYARLAMYCVWVAYEASWWHHHARGGLVGEERSGKIQVYNGRWF